ncbi:hypothetical protein AVEN_19425-1 [Araneus ventricosus]|uniref:Uncharacterized protein n=1 Tax=Araneus ventricosus TaxID=182803 RepID=A0A4Y2C661_ARAVE|nr:hypothetical protein AVEN_19425-1 [Araneus ventricosus]
MRIWCTFSISLAVGNHQFRVARKFREWSTCSFTVHVTSRWSGVNVSASKPEASRFETRFHRRIAVYVGLKHVESEKYREDSSTFEVPYFVAKVAKMVAKFVSKAGEPDVAAASHPILIPVKLSSQP